MDPLPLPVGPITIPIKSDLNSESFNIIEIFEVEYLRGALLNARDAFLLYDDMY